VESNVRLIEKRASSLNHPHILVIYEIGTEGNTHYIASEFIEGKTLREHFKQSPMKLSEVLDISIQIAGALTAAHAAHIIHRDIKPENIMVRPDGYVKILDFGLAKLVEQQKSRIGLEDETALFLSLVDAKTENQLWGKQYNRKLTNLLSLQTEIARDVSDNLKTKLTGADEQKLTRSYTANPEAYRLYLQGRYFWNKRTEKDIRKSIEYFDQAVVLDPNYALAYTGISDAYSNLGSGINFSPILPAKSLPKAKEAALRALEIDNMLGEAHVSLGWIKERWEWDFATAQSEYMRAIELNPDYATAHHRYGVFLGTMGRFDESIAALERARQLDPLSLIIATDLSLPYFWARRHERAIEVLRKALEIDANFARAHAHLAQNYRVLGRYEEAIAEQQKAFELSGGQFREDGTKRVNGTLAVIYAAAGRKSEAQKILDEMTEAEKHGDYLYSFGRAVIYAELGDKERAFAWLEKAFAERFSGMTELKVAPTFDSLHDDPRFQDLLRRVGFPQ